MLHCAICGLRKILFSVLFISPLTTIKGEKTCRVISKRNWPISFISIAPTIWTIYTLQECCIQNTKIRCLIEMSDILPEILQFVVVLPLRWKYWDVLQGFEAIASLIDSICNDSIDVGTKLTKKYDFITQLIMTGLITFYLVNLGLCCFLIKKLKDVSVAHLIWKYYTLSMLITSLICILYSNLLTKDVVKVINEMFQHKMEVILMEFNNRDEIRKSVTKFNEIFTIYRRHRISLYRLFSISDILNATCCTYVCIIMVYFLLTLNEFDYYVTEWYYRNTMWIYLATFHLFLLQDEEWVSITFIFLCFHYHLRLMKQFPSVDFHELS